MRVNASFLKKRLRRLRQWPHDKPILTLEFDPSNLPLPGFSVQRFQHRDRPDNLVIGLHCSVKGLDPVAMVELEIPWRRPRPVDPQIRIGSY